MWGGGHTEALQVGCHQCRLSRGRAAHQTKTVIPFDPGIVFLELCLKKTSTSYHGKKKKTKHFKKRKKTSRQEDKNKVFVEVLFPREILEAFGRPSSQGLITVPCGIGVSRHVPEGF